ncbi:MAG TPA: hypothetical protein VFC79_02390 [Tissierellaceae bacterium]|nr:hypothetical protein [Tissierellaceae bacterium]
MSKAKSFDISKRQVFEAYKAVKANRGSAGIDEVSISEFDNNLKNNLYKLWNRCHQEHIFQIQLKLFIYQRKMEVSGY